MLIVTAVVLVLALLLVQYLTVRKIVADRRRAAEEQQRIRETEGAEAAQMLGGMGPAGRVALGGVLVSLYGLWGFARGTAELPFLVAIGFCAMFDVLELQLFRLLYQTADPRKGKTPQYKLMHGTAWGLVSLSATANFVHAPNAVSAPFMAVMPAAAAWVIELELRKRMAGSEKVEEDKGSGGPIRLVIKIWHKVWAAIYGAAGIDPGEKNSEMAQKALGRKAAKRAYELRLSLERQQGLQRQVEALKSEVSSREKTRRLGELQAELDTLAKRTRGPRKRAQKMLMRGDLHEPAATLELLRRMAWLTRTDDVALLTYGPDSKAKQVMEELNIAANADFVEASNRAKEINARAAEVDKVRRKTEKEIEEATKQLNALKGEIETAKKQADEAVETATKQQEEEQNKLSLLREERERLESNDASSEQLYKKTSDELETARQELARANENVREAQDRARELEGQQGTLQERLKRTLDEQEDLKRTAREMADQAQEARNEVVRLQERLAVVEQQAAGVSAKSAKPRGVDARIDAPRKDQGIDPANGGGTRAQIRSLLQKLSPDQRELSQHQLAALLEPDLSVGADAIRRHLRAIANEEAEHAKPDVPGQREETEPAGHGVEQ
ncbi:hypothetical protein [Streptomyces natalensis]|uniref:Chromosome partition protein Smc n=1 Tax=Streptomyces natalensis ATCC 27448 TaxID=1240678 RepID=A0A0D7CHE1_9ACTN|nr:hypothetical protein [Streptomyces natalensis]KIZ15628.1 hypothetical protein SNA_25730 [Streptomyces natalensis ATCC 27448]